MHLTKILKEGLCINTEAWQGTSLWQNLTFYLLLKYQPLLLYYKNGTSHLCFSCTVQVLPASSTNEIIQLFRLEKTFKIIESNQKPNPAKSTTKPISILILLARWFKCSWSAMSLYFLFFFLLFLAYGALKKLSSNCSILLFVIDELESNLT